MVRHPVPTFTITWRYTSPTQSRDALHVQPRLRGEGETSTTRNSLSLTPVSHPPTLMAASPSSGLSLSRQMATITYMCQYTTHPASRAFPTTPALPRQSAPPRVAVRLFSIFSSDIALSHSRDSLYHRLCSSFSFLSRSPFVSFLSSLFRTSFSLSLYFFLSLFSNSRGDKRIRLKREKEKYRNSLVDELSTGAKRDIVYGYITARFLKLSSRSRGFHRVQPRR